MLQDLQCKHTSTPKGDGLFNGDNNENGASFILECPQESSISDICSLTPDKLEDINILGENTNFVSTREIEETRNNTVV